LRHCTKSEPLTEAELDRLGDFLDCCKGGKAMNVEQLDGFFAALIAGPETVMPSEYNREVFGGEMSDACKFANIDEAKEILGLLTRHWNAIAAALNKDEVYEPILLQDENGMAQGNNWADGFMRGVGMRHDGWARLVNDEEHGGCMIPMFMLYHEHDKDPRMRPKRIGPEQREKIILHMAAGLVMAYRFFRSPRRADLPTSASATHRGTARIGRNDRCPCGSGKKYKRCCGHPTIN